MSEHIGKLFLISISFLLSVTSYSQGLGNSPYSRIGIGDVVNYKGTVRNIGMGNAGSILSGKDHMNILNPAGLANFKDRYTDSLVKIDVGYSIQYKTFEIGENSSQAWGANINYLAFVFPVSKVYTTGIVLTPFTTVQNNYSFMDSISNDPNNYTTNYKYRGTGGIYQFQWANGVGVTKNLSVGLTTNFNFGSIIQESTTQLISDPYNVNKENEKGTSRKTGYSGVSFKPGFIYNKQLYTYIDSITQKATGIFFSAGASAEFSTGIKATETRNLFERNSSNNTVIDSTLTRTRAPAYLPSVYRLGFGLDKPDKWAVALDLSYSDWSDFNKNTFKNDSLSTSSYSAFLGAEYLKFNPRRPIKSKTYRAGFMYSATPIVVGGNRVYDYSVSIGASLPVGTRINQKGIPILPKLNVAFVVGQRTSMNENQLSETYYRLHLSMVIYDKWFTKRRIQ